MKALWIALGIVGTIPLLAAAQHAPTRSVIKSIGFHHGGCGCQEPAPTCCTPVPPPSIGNCCPKLCLLERLHRGLRSLDCLLPCSLGCHSINCHSSCPSCTSSAPSCSAGCEVRSSCGSCCTKSRAHFFAFCKPKCGSSCGSASCHGPVSCHSPCRMGCSAPCHVGCSDSVPMMQPPVPMMEDNPFKDDIRPADPNTPPPGQSTYKPYWKKNTTTARANPPMPTPARLDPYAAAPVRIKAQPANSQPVHSQPARVAAPVKIASRLPDVTSERATVKMAIAQEIETVSLTVADDVPPAPPENLSTVVKTVSVPKRREAGVPVNPLR